MKMIIPLFLGFGQEHGFQKNGVRCGGRMRTEWLDLKRTAIEEMPAILAVLVASQHKQNLSF